MAFADAVIALCAERRWKQADLARASGLPTATLSRLMSGKQANPTQDTQTRLAAAFGIPVTELVRRAGATPGAEGFALPEGEELALIYQGLGSPAQAALLLIARALRDQAGR